ATVVGELKRHFRDKRWGVHVVRSDQELYLRVRDTATTLATELGVSPTASQIAKRCGLAEEDVLRAQELAGAFKVRSLDAAAPHGDGGDRKSVVEGNGV